MLLEKLDNISKAKIKMVAPLPKIEAVTPGPAHESGAVLPAPEQYRLGVNDVTMAFSVDRERMTIPTQATPLDIERTGRTGHDQRLVTALRVGDKTLGVVKVTAEGHWPMFGVVDIRQDEPQYDVERAIRMPKLLGWIAPDSTMVVGSERFPNLSGYVEPQSCEIALEHGRMTVCRLGEQPVSLIISDGRQHPDGPFEYMPWEIPQGKIDEHVASVEAAGGWSPEFVVDSTKFKLVGRDPSGHLVLTSTDERGQQRLMLVYKSRSEGSWRVSQGRESVNREGKQEVRLLKGAEGLVQDDQYTQDTQLHPQLAENLDRILDTDADEAAVPSTKLMYGMYTAAQVEHLHRDFAAHTRTLPLEQSIDAHLRRLRAGHLSVDDITKLTGYIDPTHRNLQLRRDITELNQALERAGVMPDFSRGPQYTSIESHPVLGHYASEVYATVTNGHSVEWHMARDPQGRVWVERIRFADSPATPYGTDGVIPYSGILTSKPLEYKDQCDGLPPEWRGDIGNAQYYDISPFLDQLLPIQRYRATARTLREKTNHVVTSNGMVSF